MRVSADTPPWCLWAVMKEREAIREDKTRSVIETSYREYRHALVRFATVLVGADDANDVVSSAMLTVLERDPDRIDNPRAYIYQAVANQARNHKRGEARRHRREERSAIRSGSETFPEPYPEVREAIEGLSVRQRAVVYLFYWEDLSEDTVAERLGISAGSVRQHLFRARRNLRRAISDHDE